MKSLFIAASAAGALLAAAPAFAQTVPFNQFYGTLGYNNYGVDNGPDISAITGRLGYRPMPYLGVEGEVSTGLSSDHRVGLNDQYAGYAVGYVPVGPNVDVLARIGYGHSDFHTPTGGFGADSLNYGVGGQYFFDHHNGLRVDYTRENYECSGCSSADVWSVAYVRKF